MFVKLLNTPLCPRTIRSYEEQFMPGKVTDLQSLTLPQMEYFTGIFPETFSPSSQMDLTEAHLLLQ